MNIKETKGITLVALVLTVMLVILVAGISFQEGGNVIKQTELEGLRTNMLLMQAKSKEYVEKAIFNMGIDPDDTKKEEARNKIYVDEAKLEKAEKIPSKFNIGDNEICYWITEEALNSWGLNEVKLSEDERYLIKFDETNETAEVYATKGFDGKYSLTDINQIEL